MFSGELLKISSCRIMHTILHQALHDFYYYPKTAVCHAKKQRSVKGHFSSGLSGSGSFETLHVAHLVYLGLLLVAPDIPQLERASGRERDLRLFAVRAASYDLSERDKAGHLPVFCHLDRPFPAPDRPGRRLLPAGFFFITEFADTALLIQQPPRIEDILV
jgi:hypothetical protein